MGKSEMKQNPEMSLGHIQSKRLTELESVISRRVSQKNLLQRS